MTNYYIKLYNENLEKMCDLVAAELKLDDLTKAVLRSYVYSNNWRHREKIIRSQIVFDETNSSAIDIADMELTNLGLIKDGELVIPTYDALQKMKAKESSHE